MTGKKTNALLKKPLKSFQGQTNSETYCKKKTTRLLNKNLSNSVQN